MSTLNVGTVNASSVVTTGDVNADSNTLFVDSSANRVGVGTSSPSATFEIADIGTGVKFLSTPLMEKAYVYGSTVNSTTNIDALRSGVHVFTSAGTGNWTHNLRGDSSNTLNSILGIGQVTIITVITGLGLTSGYTTSLNIDGSSQTVNWTNGVQPIPKSQTSGFDMYTYTVIKTADATFTVLGSNTVFG